jgi:DNA polymerase-3 subunit alpha
VGEQAAERILAERAAGGPFRDFHDFLLRADSRAINKRVLENLVATGAFDFSGAPREELFGQIDEALSALGELLRKYPALRPDVPDAGRPAEHAETMLLDLADSAAPAPPPDRARLAREFTELLRHTRKAPAASPAASPGAGEHGLLDLGAGAHSPAKTNGGRTAAPPAPDRLLTPATRLLFEKELLGFYISGHPMNVFAGLADAINTVPEDQVRDIPDRGEFRLCGVATAITKKLSKKDNRPWAAFTLATRTLSLPMNLFSDAYEEYARNLVAETPVLVQGNVLGGTDGVRINVRECYPLDQIVASLVRKVTWLLRPDHPELVAFLRALRSTVDASCGDTRLEFAFVFDGRIAPFADASPGLGWKLVPADFQRLRAHPAVAGALVETKRLQLKESRRWTKR